jgi:hypothetical protein
MLTLIYKLAALKKAASFDLITIRAIVKLLSFGMKILLWTALL